jgi:hypothetical protein
MGLTQGPEEKNALAGFFRGMVWACWMGDVIKEHSEQKTCQNKGTIRQGRNSMGKGAHCAAHNPHCHSDAPRLF